LLVTRVALLSPQKNLSSLEYSASDIESQMIKVKRVWREGKMGSLFFQTRR